MVKAEFAAVMAYLGAALDKPLPPERVEVYFDLLGDLPLETLRIAAKRVALSHPWATFPSVAEFRQAASETLRGVAAELSPAEAWDLAWRAAGKMDSEVEGRNARVLKDLPARVVEAMQAFGLQPLIYGAEPVGVIRGQFVKIYEQLLARDQKVALLPAHLKQRIESVPDELPAPTHQLRDLLKHVGKVPE